MVRHPYSPLICRRNHAKASVDLSEEQIVQIFSSAGKVVNFRLVYDRETGRPKGFGFAEYPDSGMVPLISWLPYDC